MERQYNEDVVELGTVSADTKGAGVIVEDTDLGQSLPGGMIDD
jgi:hypothetical protein